MPDLIQGNSTIPYGHAIAYGVDYASTSTTSSGTSSRWMEETTPISFSNMYPNFYTWMEAHREKEKPNWKEKYKK